MKANRFSPVGTVVVVVLGVVVGTGGSPLQVTLKSGLGVCS